MTTLREVIQMALDALIDAADSQSWEMQQNIDQHGDWYRRSVYLKEAVTKSQETIKALRAALAQPEQEPVAWMYDWYDETEDIDGVPIGGIVSDCISKDYDEAHSPTMGCHNIRPLYTAPPQRECCCGDSQALGIVHRADKPCFHYEQREWVGLTSEERLALWNGLECDLECMKPAQYAEAIEAKLKEKNNG